MSFQPVLPLGGLAGWGFLKRTMERQQAVQQAAPVQKRDEAYFREKIGKIDTAEQLVSDKRLLRIALTAFGLEADVNSKAFVQKILEGGTLKEGSLANKLADKQYQKFSAAFGFGDFSVPRTKISTFPDEILTQFRARSFEAAVGTQNNTYRLALNAERELPILAARPISDTAKWYTLWVTPRCARWCKPPLACRKALRRLISTNRFRSCRRGPRRPSDPPRSASSPTLPRWTA